MSAVGPFEGDESHRKCSDLRTRFLGQRRRNCVCIGGSAKSRQPTFGECAVRSLDYTMTGVFVALDSDPIRDVLAD